MTAFTVRPWAALGALTLACSPAGGPLQPPGGVMASCAPGTSAEARPVTDPNGPYYHQVVVATTTDGITLTGPRQQLDHASVPDGVRLADGRVLVYYVNGATGAVWVASWDRDSLRPLGAITLNNVPAPAGVVDPDAFLVDGRVRLAYLAGFGASARSICTADSDDGIRFTARGPSLAVTPGEPLTDPSVIRLADGTWLMAISRGQQSVIARSADGTTFTREATLALGGVPELAVAPDGSTRLYVCGGGIVSHRSTDAGRTWTREGTVVGPGFNGKPIVCDPSLIAGAGLFVFKTG